MKGVSCFRSGTAYLRGYEPSMLYPSDMTVERLRRMSKYNAAAESSIKAIHSEG